MGEDRTPEVVVITGGSRGIGAACAEALAASGAKLSLVAAHSGPLEEMADLLSRRGAEVLALAGDVADEAFAARVFGETERRLGPVTALVNNAGTLEKGRVEAMEASHWERVLDVNLKGAFLFSREAVQRMRPRGRGRIIGVSSISGTLGTPTMAAYCASKWGLNGLIKSLAEELRGTGVLSMGVAPGSVDTRMLKAAGFEPQIRPEEIAAVIRFLVREAPSAMQGSIVEVFG